MDITVTTMVADTVMIATIPTIVIDVMMGTEAITATGITGVITTVTTRSITGITTAVMMADTASVTGCIVSKRSHATVVAMSGG